jgi:hypothetical protein
LPKILNLNEINIIVESYGFKLLSTEYINTRTPLYLQCKLGHIFQRNLNALKYKNNECPICKKENSIHGLVIPIEDILEEFNDYGFTILKGIENYKNGDSEFLIQCPQGHIYNEKVKYFKQKHKCPYCSKKTKPTIEQINKDFKERNLILLTDFYINKRTKMDFICEKHPNIIQHIDWDHFHNRGQGCKYCGYEKIAQQKLLDQNFIFNCFQECNYTLLPNQTYQGNNIPLLFVCNKHPNIIQSGDYSHLQTYGNICTFCRYEKNSGENHYNWKGGISPLNYYLREHILKWKIDSIKSCDYKCIINNNDFEVIHHLYPYYKILDEILNILNMPIYPIISDYTENQLKLLENKILELHYKYPLGVCLTKDLHNEFHSIYGQKNFAPEDFYEFYKIKTGKEFIPVYKQFEIA